MLDGKRHRHAADFCLHLSNNLLEDRHADNARPRAKGERTAGVAPLQTLFSHVGAICPRNHLQFSRNRPEVTI
jgi:hypothetical protein